MGNFSLTFIDECRGYFNEPAMKFDLVVADLHEQIFASLEVWSKQDYFDQWREGLKRIIDHKRSVLVTCVHHPKTANYIELWELYVIENYVEAQNTYLAIDELDSPFDKNNVYKYVGDRVVELDDGEEIIEWRISLKDVAACLKSVEVMAAKHL